MTLKFCNSCGAENKINASYCNYCAYDFSEDSHIPRYDPEPNALPMNSSGSSAPYVPSAFVQRPHQEWHEPSFFKSIFLAIMDPKMARGLYEDPQAPKVYRVIYLVILSFAFQSFMENHRTTGIIQGEVIEESSFYAAFVASGVFLIGIYLASLVLSIYFRLSIPESSPLSKRQFPTAFRVTVLRSVLLIPYYLIKGVLLIFEENRIIEINQIDLGDLGNTGVPIVTNPYSDFYYTILLAVVILTYLFSANYMYFAAKSSLGISKEYAIFLAASILLFGLMFKATIYLV